MTISKDGDITTNKRTTLERTSLKTKNKKIEFALRKYYYLTIFVQMKKYEQKKYFQTL